jgi:hypothetical protein
MKAKTARWQLLLFLGFGILFPWQAQAKKHKQPPTPAPLATPASEPPPLPAENTPNIDPALPPSASLQPFLDTHLREILTPLGVPAFAQPELLASMKASYADGMAIAPATHKLAFQFAQAVCEAMTGAITERQNAVAALRGALATRSSEAEQPKGGGEAPRTTGFSGRAASAKASPRSICENAPWNARSAHGRRHRQQFSRRCRRRPIPRQPPRSCRLHPRPRRARCPPSRAPPRQLSWRPPQFPGRQSPHSRRPPTGRTRPLESG